VPLFESGALKPVPVTKYPMRKAGEALRLMQAGLHTGKLVLTLDGDDTAPIPRVILPRTDLFRCDGTYVVTGGFGGLGLKMAQWLGRGGAGRIVLLSRSGPQTRRARNTIASLRLSGVDIAAEAIDVCDAAQLSTLIQAQAASGKPVRGVFHLAMVLRDHPALELSDADIEAAMKPKFDGAKALIAAVESCDPPCDLDFLFLASTIAALFGNAGQANYAAGCAQLDALANSRASAGKPTFSVNIGSLGGVGFVAANVSVQRALKLRGLHPMQPDAFLAAIEQIIRSESLGKVRVCERAIRCGCSSSSCVVSVLCSRSRTRNHSTLLAPRSSSCRWARRTCTSLRRSGSVSRARR
jgi:NAD(P)-dependent dehydrogenase (short-subunit alcohol dehydrogenase family)